MDQQQQQGNPFADIMSKAQGSQGVDRASSAQQQANAVIGAAQGGAALPEESQLNRGQNPGNSSPLLNAVQQLEKFVQMATEPDEIKMTREIIRLLSKLIDKDQERMGSEL